MATGTVATGAAATGTVARIRRYPVKSMLGEDLAAGVFGGKGLAGDRVFAVLDDAGAVGSAKHPRKWGPLLSCRSTVGADGTVRVRVASPDGAEYIAGSDELDDRLSRLLGRPVVVSDKPPENGLLERAVPEYEGGSPRAARSAAVTDATGTAITSGHVAAGTFFDFGPVHVVTTASLEALRRRHPDHDFDARRFRPNVVIDTGARDGFPEDEWQGRRIRIGDAVLQVMVPTPRCVIPTLAHDELPADPGLMRAAAREHRIPVFDMGPLTCVGVYLQIVEPGVVRLGDRVAVEG